MRIDLNFVPQDLATQKAEKPSVSKRAQLEKSDNSDSHNDTVSLSALVQQALSVPEMREQRIEDLRQAIESGQYSVNSTQIAAAILASAGK